MKRPPFLLAAGWLVAVLQAENVPAMAPADRASARKVYVAKCAKCHRFYDPHDYAAADWNRWMKSMAERSKLKPVQTELLTRYLDLYRSGQLPHKPEAKPGRK